MMTKYSYPQPSVRSLTTSVVDLTFALWLPRILHANAKSKTTLESNIY